MSTCRNVGSHCTRTRQVVPSTSLTVRLHHTRSPAWLYSTCDVIILKVYRKDGQRNPCQQSSLDIILLGSAAELPQNDQSLELETCAAAPLFTFPSPIHWIQELSSFKYHSLPRVGHPQLHPFGKSQSSCNVF